MQTALAFRCYMEGRFADRWCARDFGLFEKLSECHCLDDARVASELVERYNMIYTTFSLADVRPGPVEGQTTRFCD